MQYILNSNVKSLIVQTLPLKIPIIQSKIVNLDVRFANLLNLVSLSQAMPKLQLLKLQQVILINFELSEINLNLVTIEVSNSIFLSKQNLGKLIIGSKDSLKIIRLQNVHFPLL